MSNLESILKDFYDCLDIPIQFVNEKFIPIYKMGFSKDIDFVLEKTNIYNNLKESTISSINLTYFENIHFIVTPLTDTRFDGYFIVGPFKSKYICSELNIPFKPYSCINYILTMLKSIIKGQINKDNKFNPYIKDSIDYIHKNYASTNMDDICNYLSINKSYFCSIFKKETGYTFTNFLNKFRIEKSKEFLKNKNFTILDVALLVGYNNHNYYTILFKKLNGITPIEYRNNLKAS